MDLSVCVSVCLYVCMCVVRVQLQGFAVERKGERESVCLSVSMSEG